MTADHQGESRSADVPGGSGKRRLVMASYALSTLWWFNCDYYPPLRSILSSRSVMYRDESETLHEADRSHNVAAAFMRNLRCSTVKSTDVGAC